jgi:asparagine synthase (glutamine-hydrolysing)
MSFLRFTNSAKQGLFTAQARQQIDDDDSLAKILTHFDTDNARDLVDRMLYTDLMTRIPDHNMVIGDRMSMAHSLEARCPFVDYKLVEYAASIPSDLKLNGRKLKYILRRVASRYLPRELVYRKKQGFGFPLGIWMRTDLKDFLQRLFADSRFVQANIFNEQYVARILDDHMSGRFDHSYRLWILLNLEIWYRLYVEQETMESMHTFTQRLMVS